MPVSQGYHGPMVRPSQLLHAPKPPVTPRPAATVLLMRDTPQGPQVLMTRRSATASFAPNAYVFPGGAIDPADAQAHPLSTRRPGQSDDALTQALAALRESFEELGVLLARDAQGQWVPPATVQALDRHGNWLTQLQAHGLTLSGAEVFPLAHWITDRDLPKRFDVPFLVARMPPGQEPVPDNREQFEPVWLHPATALAEHEAGRFFMIFPTVRTLQRLVAFPDVQAVLDACASERPLFTSCPRGGWLKGQEVRFMEHEAPYGELELVCPDGQMQHALDWDPTRAVPLLRHVQRITAPNPGMMTGPGTNTYVVGDAATGHVVIDPGPDDASHLQRVFDAAQGDIRAIVCTHSHPDHSPGARPLQALCTAAGLPRPEVLGLASAPTARADSAFTPDRELQNQELLTLTNKALGADFSHNLLILHTPGHAANHLCLVLLEDGLLFSGDHVLNGSTTVINPPDGHMGLYLHSLDQLMAACDQHAITHILPAHGHVLGQARNTLAQLKQHRLTREAKVLAALRAQPQGTPADWVQQAYADTPSALWPLAQRSLLAHVQHLQEQGLT